MRRIVRSSFVLGFLQAGLLHVMSVELQLRWLIVGPLVSVVLLLWFRGGYRAWLSAARAAGRHLRDVVVIGVNADAADLVDMLADHPEAGFRVMRRRRRSRAWRSSMACRRCTSAPSTTC